MLSGSRWAKTAIRASSRAAAITKTSTSRRGMVGELAGAHSYRQGLGRAIAMTSIARGAEVRDKGGKNPQVLRLFLGSCVLQQDANLGRAAGSGSTLGSAPTATLGGAHQVHRFATVAISDLSVGTFLKQIANDIH